MIKDHIKTRIQTILQEMKIEATAELEYPLISSFGDYSSSIAMKLTKKLKKNPMLIAEEIATKIKPDDIIEKVETAKPGFINFWITKKNLVDNLKSISSRGENYGRSDILKNKKIIVEFTDPNPFKEFHIGHLYSNIVGESLARLHEALGADVRRVTYQGDVGMHVAKSIWGMKKLMEQEKTTLDDLQKQPLSDRVKFLGKSYAEGATAFEENEKARQEIITINKQVYQKEQAVTEIYETGRRWSLEHFDSIYERLGSKFDTNFFESEVGQKGVELVKENMKTGVFKESDGAIIFPGEDYGLHTRVFINSLGLPTYEAKELGLAPAKYEWFPYDESIIVTGNEINDYFKVLLAALEKIYPDLRKKTEHISHGMVRLPEGKMSSRTGKILRGEWLLDEAAQKALEVIKLTIEKKADPNENIDRELGWIADTAEAIGKAAVKYALLKNGIGRDVEFNFNESVSFEGNSGPYLQYTYVRCRSVIEKSHIDLQAATATEDTKLNEEELSIMRTLIKFPEIIIDTALHNSPNLISNFLYDIAQKYNLFYQKHSILNADDETKKLRILLTHSVSQVIDNGLNLLGIQTVEKM